MGSVVSALARARRAARALLVLGEGSRIGAAGLTAIMAAALVDYVLRLPVELRIALWLVGVGLLGWSLWKYLLPAARFHPRLTEVALRLEKSDAGRQAGLEGKLASAIELEQETHPSEVESSLAAAAVRDAAERARSIRPGVVLAPTWSMRRMGLLAGALACAALAAMITPSLAMTGAKRIALPWSGAEWPKRTLVADATSEDVHAIGRALALRAVLTKTDHPEGETRVVAKYRIIADGEEGPLRRVMMTSQRSDLALDSGKSGELFERLVETRGVATGSESTHIEYWFETDDDRTPVRRVRLEEPPRVVQAEAKIVPPSYASSIAGLAGFVEGDFDLGAGDDERAVVGPILAGSRIELTIDFNKNVRAPTEGAPAYDLGEPAIGPERWAITWVADESLRLPIEPVDEHGLSGYDEQVFSFDVGEDLSPTAAIIEPAQDEMVLASAVVSVTGEGQDDIGVARITLERQLALVPAGSIGAPPEAQDEVVTVVEKVIEQNGEYTPRATVEATLELASLALSPGDEVWLTAQVSDTYEVEGQAHEGVRSGVRRLRVISEGDLIEQVRRELAGVRSAAMRLDAEQASTTRGLERAEPTEDLARRQRDIEASLDRQRELVEDMAARLERNRLEDSVLRGTLSDAAALLESAKAAAGEAGAALSDAASNPDGAPTEAQRERTEAEQERVRDELQRLAELLDRGEDAWLVQRQLERLLADQRALTEQTKQAGQETTGQKLEDLTDEQRAKLNDISERQEGLAERLRQAVEDLEERSEQMKDIDALQSQAMRDAADRARRENVDQDMEQAAQQASENQTNQANEAQQRAEQALSQMLDEMQQSEQRRDETLRRVLASLIESLETLITQQEREVGALGTANKSGVYTGLDSAMIKLHQNTLGVLDQVAAGFAELATLRSLLDRAAEAQAAAIVSLRASPVDGEHAEANEQESLRRLREAKAEAERLDQEAQQREAERARDELEASYREALETQVAIRADTADLIDNVKTRRDYQRSRRLGAAERELQEKLSEIAEKSDALAEAGIFKFAHKRLDMLLQRLGDALGEAKVDRGVTLDQDSVVHILQSLVSALKTDGQQQQDEFREGQAQQQGGGQQGQQQPAIPPIAELKLLRMLQEEVMLRTRQAESAGASTTEVDDIGQVQRELSSQADDLIMKMQQQPGEPGGGI